MLRYTCPNYELISVAQRSSLLLTIDHGDLPHDFPTNISGATLDQGILTLQCTDEKGQAFELAFPGMLDGDAIRLRAWSSTFCTMSEKGDVVNAAAFPAPPQPLRPRARMG